MTQFIATKYVLWFLCTYLSHLTPIIGSFFICHHFNSIKEVPSNWRSLHLFRVTLVLTLCQESDTRARSWPSCFQKFLGPFSANDEIYEGIISTLSDGLHYGVDGCLWGSHPGLDWSRVREPGIGNLMFINLWGRTDVNSNALDIDSEKAMSYR